MYLLRQQTSNTSGNQLAVFIRRPVAVFPEGVYGAATLGIEVKPKGGTEWKRLADAIFNATTNEPVMLNIGGYFIRGYVENADGNTALNLRIVN